MSLVETLLSMALTLVLSGAILSLVSAGQAIARTEPEWGDLQQRARIAMRTLGDALRDAGAGVERGTLAGPLVQHFPPIAPSVDGGITVWRTTTRDAQASPSMIVALGATTIALQDSGVCPVGLAACAFPAPSSAIVFTAGGCRTTIRIAATTADSLHLAAPLAGCALDPASVVVAGEVVTYRLDASARELVRRDESTGSSAPVLNGVAGFDVAYYADTGASTAIVGSTDLELCRARLVRVTLRLVATNPLVHVPELSVSMNVAPRNAEPAS
jgi:hypothetical protein